MTINDILKNKSPEGDFQWAFSPRDFPSYGVCDPLPLGKIKKRVLSSNGVNQAIDTIAESSGRTRDDVRIEAEELIQEMSHSLSMGVVRSFGVVLTKIFRRLFSSINVDESKMSKIRETFQHSPVIFLPTHRSYMDFLLVSYACFYYSLPLPVIAAAMDFMGMAFVGSLLRNCGAFYMKRSFHNDALYWAIFSEYVQCHIRSGTNPIEFFIEGTRSRSGKSLSPKTGMMRIVASEYFAAGVPDIHFVPISISYERILEEALYAYELATGLPKPRESSSGLLKARGVLSNPNPGSVFLTFGEPISLRNLVNMIPISRREVGLLPGHEVRRRAERLEGFYGPISQHIVRCQLNDMIVHPWSFAAGFILHAGEEQVAFSTLVESCNLLIGLVRRSFPDLRLTGEVKPCLKRSFKVHEALLSANSLNDVKIRGFASNRKNKNQLLNNILSSISLQNYKHQVAHLVSEYALLVAQISISSFTKYDEAFLRKHQKLCNLFQFEFVNFNTDDTIFESQPRTAVLTLLNHLVEFGALELHSDHSYSVCLNSTLAEYLIQFIMPYFCLYGHFLAYLLANDGKQSGRTQGAHVKSFHSHLHTLAKEPNIPLEMVSTDIANNAFKSFIKLGVLLHEGGNHFVVNALAAEAVVSFLRPLSPADFPIQLSFLNSHL